MERRGDWMMTYTGRKFYPLDPRPEDIDLRDIAWALAHQCRYNGHCAFFYSVAEHSVLMSKTFEGAPLARQALLHDAAEAYIGDMIRPLKHSIPQFREIERQLEQAIFRRFGLPSGTDHLVKDADTAILADERNALFDPGVCDAHGWTDSERLGVTVTGWAPSTAYDSFILRAHQIGGLS